MFFPPPVSDTVGTLLSVLVVMLLVPLAAEKLLLPGFACVALAGALIGPFGFGLIEGGRTIELLGEIGLLYAFFLAGSELDFSALKRHRFPHAFASFAAILLSFGAGFATGYWMLGAGFPPAILIGAAFAARTVRPHESAARLGLLRARTTLVATGSASAAELVAVLALAAVTALAAPSAAPGAAPARDFLRLGAGLLVAALLYLFVPKAAGLFFKRVRPDGSIEFVFVLVLAFLCAFAAERFGFKPEIGAFFAGFFLARFVPESSALRARLSFAGEALFVPFFLIHAGTRADIVGALSDSGSAVLVLEALALYLAARFAAAYLKRPLLGFSNAEALYSFGLALNPGTVALGTLLVGSRLGLVDEGVFGGALVVVIASGFIGPLVARAAGGRILARGGPAPAAQAPERERIMVAVANPASLGNLVDLACLLRARGDEEPLFPVAVVAESADTEAELERAESVLAKVMAQTARAGVPVRPATRVSVNVPEGILQAAAENRARTLVIGWNRAPKFSRAFFGSVIERLLQGGRELVVVARVAKPVKNIARVNLVLPPLAERHPGFARGLAALGAFLERSGAHLTVYAQAPHAAAARTAAEGLKARGQIGVVEFESWKSVAEKAKSANAAQAAFVIFCSRPGGPAWHPAVEKLPHLLGEEFPDAPLLLFYLPDEGEATARPLPEGEPLPVQADLFSAALSAGRVMTAMGETAVADGVRALLSLAFGKDRRALGRLASLYTEIAQKAPIELDPGVVLLHAHVTEVDEPLVFFGARPQGFRILALEEPARVLIILCAPEGQPPEAHLAVLGEIARLLKDLDLAARLLAAARPAELSSPARTGNDAKEHGR
ncbi:MAG: cation:proton antiporter [Spirochaetaceae bacterium]|nr:cation:proton antiporter [Spirochaetaceae bacterium]